MGNRFSRENIEAQAGWFCHRREIIPLHAEIMSFSTGFFSSIIHNNDIRAVCNDRRVATAATVLIEFNAGRSARPECYLRCG